MGKASDQREQQLAENRTVMETLGQQNEALAAVSQGIQALLKQPD
jgi:hypothetical protein